MTELHDRAAALLALIQKGIDSGQKFTSIIDDTPLGDAKSVLQAMIDEGEVHIEMPELTYIADPPEQLFASDSREPTTIKE